MGYLNRFDTQASLHSWINWTGIELMTEVIKRNEIVQS